MRRRGATLAVLAVALLAAGCGSDDEASDGTTTETDGPIAAGTPLKASVGPGFEISLVTEDGQTVSALEPGSYELEIEDLAAEHNFHLTGPGVDISTDVAEEGTQNVSLSVAAGTYEFVCDPHAAQMNGSFEVS